MASTDIKSADADADFNPFPDKDIDGALQRDWSLDEEKRAKRK